VVVGRTIWVQRRSAPHTRRTAVFWRIDPFCSIQSIPRSLFLYAIRSAVWTQPKEKREEEEEESSSFRERKRVTEYSRRCRVYAGCLPASRRVHIKRVIAINWRASFDRSSCFT
jgi:hypothetical protein